MDWNKCGASSNEESQTLLEIENEATCTKFMYVGGEVVETDEAGLSCS